MWLSILAWYTFVTNVLAIGLNLFVEKSASKRFFVTLFQTPVLVFVCIYLFGK